MGKNRQKSSEEKESPLLQAELFRDKEEKWLLIEGSRLGASSGVPLPFQRTKWAPSMADLVRHHAFRTQSYGMAESMESSLEEGKAPLGFVADSLEGQKAWLDKYIGDLKPRRVHMRIADLAKDGMFEAIVSSAADDLLEKALRLVKVDYQKVTLEDPLEKEDRLTLLKEWDDRVFEDREDRQKREMEFTRSRLEEKIKNVSAILVAGHHPLESDLMVALKKGLENWEELKVVWLEENFCEDPEAPVVEWLEENHENFTKIAIDDLGDFLDEVANKRFIEKSPASGSMEPPSSLIKRLLNQSFDVRPLLIYVPGMALFSGLIKKMPPISVKMMASLFSLVLLVVGFFNYGYYARYRERISPVEKNLQLCRESLEGELSPPMVTRAEGYLKDAEKMMEKARLPESSLFTMGMLEKYMKRQLRICKRELKNTRDFRITPELYRFRFMDQIESDPLLFSMGNFPDIKVQKVRKRRRNLRYKNQPFYLYRLPYRLSSFHYKNRLALFSDNSPLLKVILRKRMRRDLKKGYLAVEVNFAKTRPGSLEDSIYENMKKTIGYEGKKEDLFEVHGIRQRFREGRASFYFTDIDSSGNIGKNLIRLRNFISRFPRCSFAISAHTERAKSQIRERVEDFALLKTVDFEWAEGAAYLERKTSRRYLLRVMENNYLRWNLKKPIVLSLLCYYYRWVGEAPRSLALVYDQLLQKMLRRGEFGFAVKFKALGVLAHYMMEKELALTRERAIHLVAGLKEMGKYPDLDRASRLLDEMVRNGVILYRMEREISFIDENFKYLVGAKYLQEVKLAEKTSFLLRKNPKLTAFYAGLEEKVDSLVQAFLSDFETIRTHLEEKSESLKGEKERDGLLNQNPNLNLKLNNPYFPALKRAALAVQNGSVTFSLIDRLETYLFEMINHDSEVISQAAMDYLSNFSTPGIKERVLLGIEKDKDYDHLLLQFTARAPHDIYLGAIERWLSRVCTPLDRRNNERFTGSGTKMRINYETRLAIIHGLITLSEIGTRDALRVVEKYVTQKREKRFSQGHWTEIRSLVVKSLVANGHFDLVRSLLGEIKKNPEDWAVVLPHLYQLNDRETARTLMEIIGRPVSLTREVIDYKRAAAFSLSLIRSRHSAPFLGKYLEARPEKGLDYRPFALLALGYRGDKKNFGLVKKVVREIMMAPPKLGEHSERYYHTINSAVAFFGTKEAFSLYEKLYHRPYKIGAPGKNPPKEKGREGRTYLNRNIRGTSLDSQVGKLISYFPFPEAKDFVLRKVLNREVKEMDGALIEGLGRMGTVSARRAINQIIQMIQGRSDPAFVRMYWKGKKAITRQELAARGHLHHYIRALSFFQNSDDLPRFARWALHEDKKVRKTALRALSRFSNPLATKAVLNQMAEYDQHHSLSVEVLAKQGQRKSERALLALFDTTGKEDSLKIKIIGALGQCGGFESYLKLYPGQKVKKFSRVVRRALFFISRRNLGRDFSTGSVKKTIDGLLTSPEKKGKIEKKDQKKPRRKGKKIDEKKAKEYYYKGLKLARKEEYKKALRLFDKALQYNEKYKYALLYRARVHRELKNWKKAIKDYGKLLEFNPKSKRYYQQRGDLYYKIGSYSLALKDYRQGLKFSQGRSRYIYYHKIGRVYLSSKEDEKAEKNFQKALELNSRYGPSYYGMAQVFSEKKEREKALKHLQKALEKNLFSYSSLSVKDVEKNPRFGNLKKDQGFQKLLARAYFRQGEKYRSRPPFYSKALASYTRAIELDSQVPQFFYRRGMFYLSKLKKPSKALLDFSQVIEIDGGYKRGALFAQRGESYFQLNRLERAEKDFLRAAFLSSTWDSVCYRYLARIYGRRKKAQKALQLLEESMKRGDFYLSDNLFDVRLRKDEDLALLKNGEDFHKLIRKYQVFRQGRKAYSRAGSLQKRDPKRAKTKLRQAVDYLSEVIKRDPSLPRPYLYRGGAYRKLGEKKKALQDLSKFLELKEDYNSWDRTLIIRSKLYSQLDQYSKAMKDKERFLHTIEWDSHLDSSGYYTFVSQASGALKKYYKKKGKRGKYALYKAIAPYIYSKSYGQRYPQRAKEREAEALRLFDKALKENTDLSLALYLRGNIYLRQGKEERAEKDYRKALEIQPRMAWAHFKLASLFAKKGRTREAVKEMNLALKKGFRNLAPFLQGDEFLPLRRKEKFLKIIDPRALGEKGRK